MSTHKDLPPGSQQWARELDDAIKEMKRLQGVVSRLAENANIDMANPRRGVNSGDTPSVKNPVGQKLSSLADVATYNVLDKQVLSWSQQGQKWLPVTPPNPSGAVEIPMSYTNTYLYTSMGYGNLDHQDVNQWAYFATNWVNDQMDAEIWATDTVYLGAGNHSDGPVALVTASFDGFFRPYVRISAEDYADGTYGALTVGSYFIQMDVPYFVNPRVATADRPTTLGNTQDDVGSQTFDTDLKIPIWWNGTTWTNSLGTAV